eukprot:scaffold394242_cov41-Prasinocladus_malaysianus.AAC.1
MVGESGPTGAEGQGKGYATAAFNINPSLPITYGEQAPAAMLAGFNPHSRVEAFSQGLHARPPHDSHHHASASSHGNSPDIYLGA